MVSENVNGLFGFLKMVKLRILLAIYSNMVKIINQTSTYNNSTNSHGVVGGKFSSVEVLPRRRGMSWRRGMK